MFKKLRLFRKKIAPQPPVAQLRPLPVRPSPMVGQLRGRSPSDSHSGR